MCVTIKRLGVSFRIMGRPMGIYGNKQLVSLKTFARAQYGRRARVVRPNRTLYNDNTVESRRVLDVVVAIGSTVVDRTRVCVCAGDRYVRFAAKVFRNEYIVVRTVGRYFVRTRVATERDRRGNERVNIPKTETRALSIGYYYLECGTSTSLT